VKGWVTANTTTFNGRVTRQRFYRNKHPASSLLAIVFRSALAGFFFFLVNAGSRGASLLEARICSAFLLSAPSYGASADNSLHAANKILAISMSTQMQPRFMLLLATQYTAFKAKQEL
jgi:hypothetical protein